MALHQGKCYQKADVSIVPPDPQAILAAELSDDVAEAVRNGLTWAQSDLNVYFFAVYSDHELVGQIYLHDIDQTTQEALIGYYLYQARFRGKGIGATMLRLLQEYVRQETNLYRLTIITGKENYASRRMAERCGFHFVGGAWEDPEGLVVYQWEVQREAI